MAPIINKPDGEIDWSKSALEIFNKSRAFNPWPSTYTFFDGLTLKISSCSLIPSEPDRNYKPGQILGVNQWGIVVSTGDGLLQLNRVQLSGSKEMSASDFARGHRIEPGYVFANALMC
jgi:methionyl-tRNA formyltransferase